MMQDHYAEDALALAVRKIVQEISLPPGDLLRQVPRSRCKVQGRDAGSGKPAYNPAAEASVAGAKFNQARRLRQSGFPHHVAQRLADPTNVPHKGIDRAKVAPSAFGAGITRW
jgi:hypothetical protein